MRDRSARQPVDAETCFAIGSATKSFTSMVISMHAARTPGFSLDDPVVNFKPDFKMQDLDPSKKMTLVDILSHRTGLLLNDPLWYLGPFNRYQLYYRLPFLTQEADGFRKGFYYSNIMYTVAGLLLEFHAGRSWDDFVRKDILVPLGMADTVFTLPELLGNPNHAKGYKGLEEVPLKDLYNIGPAGGLNSNVLDLARWIRLYLDKGAAPDGTVLLSEANVKRMYDKLTATDKTQTTFYGLGWYVDQVGGNTHVFHDGTADGNTSYVSFMPDRGLGAVVLTNQNYTLNPNDTWPSKIADRIYDHLLNGAVTGTVNVPASPAPGRAVGQASAAASPSPAVPPGPLPPAGPPRDYCGMYSDQGYGDVSISLQGGGFELGYYGGRWPLKHLGGDQFILGIDAFAMIWPLPIEFKRDSGKVASVKIAFHRDSKTPVTFNKR
jgi:CubicO group peptidase (beta-lactamase class C family)